MSTTHCKNGHIFFMGHDNTYVTELPNGSICDCGGYYWVSITYDEMMDND